MNKIHSKHQSGFTIVELLIVVVVIAILAAITIVSFNGIQTRAKISSIQSDLRNIATKLASDRTIYGEYPASLSAINSGQGLVASNGATLQYTVDNTAEPKKFCVTATNGSIVYSVNQNNSIKEGTCGSTPPTRIGYTAFIGNVSNTSVYVTPSSDIPNGSWMIAVIAGTDEYDINPPSGWRTLVTRKTTGTLQTTVFGKIKGTNDNYPFTFTGVSGTSSTNNVILWGSGAAPVDLWTVGTGTTRANTGTNNTNTAAGMATVENGLTLAISTERTSAAESDLTSVNGMTKWLFNPEVQPARIQTITVAYRTETTAGATSNVTFTYPNTQPSNGYAFQLTIPPISFE